MADPDEAIDLAHAQQLQHLERFVMDNDDLTALEERIGRFNIFDALQVGRAEIRHSNFLAWLLDPAESHGLGPLFLRAILMDILNQVPPETRCLGPLELDGEELHKVEVRREWKHLDLLILCQKPPFVIAIENKIDSNEHGDQLSRYRETVNQHFRIEPKQFVYLTVGGDKPSEDHWMPYTYGDIHRVLTKVCKTHAATIGDDVRVFLDHYLRLLGSRFMDDKKIDDLCRRIYVNHQPAVKMLIRHFHDPERRIIDDIEKMIESEIMKDEEKGEVKRWHIIANESKNLRFVPVGFLSGFPEIGTHKKHGKNGWLYASFYVKDNKQLYLGFFTSPISENGQALRQNICDLLMSDPRYECAKGKRPNYSGGWDGFHAFPLDWCVDNPDYETGVEVARDQLNHLHDLFGHLKNALIPIIDDWKAQKP